MRKPPKPGITSNLARVLERGLSPIAVFSLKVWIHSKFCANSSKRALQSRVLANV
jgi:hypothetical protein